MFTIASVVSVWILACLAYQKYALYFLKAKFLFRGREMIQEATSRHDNFPFCLPTFGYGGRLHIVSTKKHLDEIGKAAHEHLSEHLWAKEQVQSQFAFGIQWAEREQRNRDGFPMGSAIRTAWNCYPKLQPKFFDIVRQELSSAFAKGRANHEGYREIYLSHTVEVIVARLNTLWTLGEDLASDAVFNKRGLAYSNEAKVISELAKLLPSFIIRPMAALIKHLTGNEEYVVDAMVRAIDEKQKEANCDPTPSATKTRTILEALVNRCPTHWTMKELIRDINITWNTTNFASPLLSIQLIQDISRYEKLQSLLRDEAFHFKDDKELKNLPLLDAFTMESMRTRIFMATRIHRMAIRDFTFSDGYAIPAGEVVQFNLQKMFLDEQVYPDAEFFEPERHLNTRVRSTDVRPEWPFWGVPKLPCPGRFFAVNTAKLMVLCLLKEWNFKLKDDDVSDVSWRDCRVPHPKARLLMKRREAEAMHS